MPSPTVDLRAKLGPGGEAFIGSFSILRAPFFGGPLFHIFGAWGRRAWARIFDARRRRVRGMIFDARGHRARDMIFVVYLSGKLVK